MEGEVPIAEVISGLALGLQDWGSNVLRDLEKRLKKAKKELEGCRRMVTSQQTVTKEAVLRFKVDRLEEQIDIFWKQRAHVNWLMKGDGNTTFFQPLWESGDLPSAPGTRQSLKNTRQTTLGEFLSANRLCRVFFVGHSVNTLPSAHSVNIF